MKKVSHQRTTRMHKGIAFALFTLAFSLVHAEQLVINYNNNGTVTQRCAFTLDATAPVVIDSASGDITAQVSDPDACGSTTPVPPTVTVTPATAAIDLGNSQTISWTSNNADSCSKSGAWSGAASLNGSETVTPASTGTFTYTITCTNNDGSTSDSSIISVTDSNVPAFCSNIPTFGLTRHDQVQKLIANIPTVVPALTYQNLTAETWPGQINNKTHFGIGAFKYVALRFVAGTGSGQHFFEAGSPSLGPAAGYVLKISQCPGDFTHNIPFDADTFFCQKEGSAVGINWSSTSTSGSCKLTPGVTYYLNVAHGSVASDNSAFINGCSTSQCSALMQRSQ